MQPILPYVLVCICKASHYMCSTTPSAEGRTEASFSSDSEGKFTTMKGRDECVNDAMTAYVRTASTLSVTKHVTDTFTPHYC